jgi:hypothetical protein
MEFAQVIITASMNKNEAKLGYNWKLQHQQLKDMEKGW